jgi:CPA1 family monovalent cation:H+ antiporter
MGIDKVGRSERYAEHMTELQARSQMISAALNWLENYIKKIEHDNAIRPEVSWHIYEYQTMKKHLESRIAGHDGKSFHDEQAEKKADLSFLLKILEVEKSELSKLWVEEKINLRTRNKLLSMLDHQIQHRLI